MVGRLNSLPSPQPDGSGQLPVRDRKQRESVVIEKTDLGFGADSRNRLAEAADPSADGDPDALLGNQRASLAQNAATRGRRGSQVAARESGSSGHQAAYAIAIGLIAVMAALNLTNR